MSVSSRDRLIPAREVEDLIADNHLIVVYEGLALKLDNWLEKHPGGHLAIQHMVGKDATDEIDAYHCDETLRRMKAFRIGRVQLPWTNFVPPIQGGVYRKLSKAGVVDEEEDLSDADLYPTADETTDDSAEEVSSLFSNQRDTLSSDSNDESDEAEADAETTAVSASSTCRLRAKKTTAAAAAKEPIKEKTLCAERLSREAYVAAMEQKEIADGIRSYPSLDQATQDAIRAEYRALHQIIKDEGLYVCHYSEYAKECVRYAMIFGGFLYFLRLEWYVPSAICLGLFWQQIMFVAHDAGHRGITGNFVADTVIGAFVGDFCNGLSIGWWKSSHNVHHLVTNMPEHDPDNQNVPIFATSPTYFKSIFSSFYKFQFVWDAVADTLVPWQKYTYYPVMCIARFNLYLLSWTHLLISPRASQLGSAWWTRYLEIVFMTCFWAIFGYGLLWRTLPDWTTRVIFVLVSHAVTMVLHVQITLSHWGMPHSDLGPTESFAQRQLRTTMDVACPAWLDFVHGGLQFQAVHHLFPRVPRHNLRKCQELVRAFCEKTRIEYQCLGFVDGNKVMLTRLQEVGQMVETLVQCSSHMAETGHYELE